MDPGSALNFAELSIADGSGGGSSNSLMQIVMADDMQPGAEPSYQICKVIYLYHPLGAKMAEAPIAMAQSQERVITIQDAPAEVKKAFLKEWADLDADANILNTHAISRVYGICSLVFGVDGVPSNVPVDMTTLYKKDVWFQVLDPLNTAGSLVLSQDPNDRNFQKATVVSTGGESYHRSRRQVVMHEQPIFIAYTTSAFGFVGRSVYQRALFPLKSFIRSMIADDMIQMKLGALVSKQKAPGSIINAAMAKIVAWKRGLIKRIQTGQVISIGLEDSIETLDMTNVDTAGTYSRKNIIKNIATAGDMPARWLENDTMVEGFGEGAEDSAKEAQSVNRVRIKLRPTYKFFENIAQYRAWNPDWYKTVIQTKYKDEYGSVSFEEAFSRWREAFVAEWPNVLIEPESEEIKKEEVKLEAVVAIVNTLLPQLDPVNKTKLIEWAADCFGENKKLFPHELEIDFDALQAYAEENQEKTDETHDTSVEAKGKKFGDSGDFTKLRAAINRLVEQQPAPAPARKRA